MGLVGYSELLAAPTLHENFDAQGRAVEAPDAPEPAGASLAPALAPTGGAVAEGAVAEGAVAESLPGLQLEDGVPAATATYGHQQSETGYRLDNETTRPSRVAYDDPFSPAMPPFKRLFAFDWIRPDFTLVVFEPSPQPFVPGEATSSADDHFFADLVVRSDGVLPVRVPTVGPGSRVVAAALMPDFPLRMFRDSAENLFVETRGAGEFHLRVHYAIERAVFGSAMRAGDGWSSLAPYLRPLPSEVAVAGQRVLRRLGLSRAMTPAAALASLVRHFRSFAPSDVAAPLLEPAALFEAVALGAAGVCRHRSFAFFVTAMALGLPARFVHNEAHAWVEVRDSQRWHRIDLGGAAGEVVLSQRSAARHVPPADPFAWPATARSGAEMVTAAESEAASSGGDDAAPASREPAGPESANNGEPSEEPAPALAAPGSSTAAVGEQVARLAQLTLHVDTSGLRRGDAVALRGEVRNSLGPCTLVPVSAYLVTGANEYPIGTLVSDEAGAFEGSVIVPPSIPLGDYELVVRTAASEGCGDGEAR